MVDERRKKKSAKAWRHEHKQQEISRRTRGGEDPLAVAVELSSSDSPGLGDDSDSLGGESGGSVVEILIRRRGCAAAPSEGTRGTGEPSGAPNSRKRTAGEDVARERETKQVQSPLRRPEVPPASRSPASGAIVRGGRPEGRSREATA